MNNLLIQPANKKEIPAILEMMEAFYAIDQYPFVRDQAESNLEMFIENPDLGRLWLGKIDQVVVGYIVLCFGFSFEYGGRDAFIDEFYLKEDFRGKGYGNKIINYVIEEAFALDVKAIHLEVESQNKTANELYLKKGFVGNQRQLLTRKL